MYISTRFNTTPPPGIHSKSILYTYQLKCRSLNWRFVLIFLFLSILMSFTCFFLGHKICILCDPVFVLPIMVTQKKVYVEYIKNLNCLQHLLKATAVIFNFLSKKEKTPYVRNLLFFFVWVIYHDSIFVVVKRLTNIETNTNSASKSTIVSNETGYCNIKATWYNKIILQCTVNVQYSVSFRTTSMKARLPEIRQYLVSYGLEL